MTLSALLCVSLSCGMLVIAIMTWLNGVKNG